MLGRLVIAVWCACALTACATAPSIPLWPNATVVAVTGAKHGACDRKRVQTVQAVLRTLTAADFYKWRMPCLCMSMTLGEALYNTQAGGTFDRNAVHVVLHDPVAVGVPTLSGKPLMIRNLVIARETGVLVKDTTMFFGRPKPPKLLLRTGVVYDGWGLKGDPFDLSHGEC